MLYSYIFVFYALGPAILGYALAYLLRHPHDWMGPAVVALPSLILTALTQTKGSEWLRKRVRLSLLELVALRVGGAVTGIVLFFLMYFMLL